MRTQGCAEGLHKIWCSLTQDVKSQVSNAYRLWASLRCRVSLLRAFYVTLGRQLQESPSGHTLTAPGSHRNLPLQRPTLTEAAKGQLTLEVRCPMMLLFLSQSPVRGEKLTTRATRRAYWNHLSHQ